MAAAIGAGLEVGEPNGNMVVDVGGGTTDVAVISLGGIVLSRSLRVGGDKLHESITRYVRKKFNLAIGDQTAEDLKIGIGTCAMDHEETRVKMKGRDLVLGLPREVEISSRDVAEAIQDNVQTIVEGIRNVLELTPPELSADIIDRGIVLTGGGALLRGLPELVSEQTEITCYVAEDPLDSVVRGTGKALDELNKLRDSGTVLSALSKRVRRKIHSQ